MGGWRHEDTPKQETLDELCDLLDEQPELETKRILGKLSYQDLLWLQKAIVKQLKQATKEVENENR